MLQSKNVLNKKFFGAPNNPRVKSCVGHFETQLLPSWMCILLIIKVANLSAGAQSLDKLSLENIQQRATIFCVCLLV